MRQKPPWKLSWKISILTLWHTLWFCCLCSSWCCISVFFPQIGTLWLSATLSSQGTHKFFELLLCRRAFFFTSNYASLQYIFIDGVLSLLSVRWDKNPGRAPHSHSPCDKNKADLWTLSILVIPLALFAAYSICDGNGIVHSGCRNILDLIIISYKTRFKYKWMNRQ